MQRTTLAKKIETGTQAKHRRVHALEITHLRHVRAVVSIFLARVVEHTASAYTVEHVREYTSAFAQPLLPEHAPTDSGRKTGRFGQTQHPVFTWTLFSLPLNIMHFLQIRQVQRLDTHKKSKRAASSHTQVCETILNDPSISQNVDCHLPSVKGLCFFRFCLRRSFSESDGRPTPRQTSVVRVKTPGKLRESHETPGSVTRGWLAK